LHTGPVRPFTIVNHPGLHPEIFTQEPKMTATLRVAPAGKGDSALNHILKMGIETLSRIVGGALDPLGVAHQILPA